MAAAARGQTERRNSNDYPQYFKRNEPQAYLESRTVGLSSIYFRASPTTEQVFMPRVCEHLLRNGFVRLFKARYLVASYDIYLGNHKAHRSFTDIHSDIPNFHQFYETEQDLTIYIRLVDLDATNGGRLR